MTQILVAPEIETGKKIVQALDDAKLKIDVAMWAVLVEYGDWRLILASRRLAAKDMREAYSTLHEALDKAGFTIRQTSSIMILGMKDKFIRELRREFGKTDDAEGMRLGGYTFADRHIEDAYVYRIS
jgi:predicted metallo-beta-lactamase superfamily hydrolase